VLWLSLFAALSLALLMLAWPTLRTPSRRGPLRFLAFEALLGLVVMGAPAWFVDPWAVRQMASWALLAAGSLAIAGVFAFLLAVSRIPGSEKIVHWPMEFFSKGLVIHVVFSLVVWFLAMFALLASFAAIEIAPGGLRWAPAGRVGVALVAMSFPMLFLTAFREDAVATLNNYLPVIIHPAYYLGLVLLAVGILLPVLRLFHPP